MNFSETVIDPEGAIDEPRHPDTGVAWGQDLTASTYVH
jgi:hypothetical protein